jgi:hypothetical protein
MDRNVAFPSTALRMTQPRDLWDRIQIYRRSRGPRKLWQRLADWDFALEMLFIAGIAIYALGSLIFRR